MNESVLGPNLEIEREKAFIARFGKVLAQKDNLNPKDSGYIRSLARKIADGKGKFSPSIAQSTWLTDIDARLSPVPVRKEDIERLIPRAEGIIQHGSLTPLRLQILIGLVDTYELKETLSRRELDMLHFLVLEGAGYSEE